MGTSCIECKGKNKNNKVLDSVCKTDKDVNFII
jgi:hypothetical protein